MDRTHVANVARHLGFHVEADWHGVDAVWLLLERIRSDGAVVLVKLDGERTTVDDTGPYTVMASGAPLNADAIRTDAQTVEDALAFVIARYAEKVWGIPLPV